MSTIKNKLELRPSFIIGTENRRSKIQPIIEKEVKLPLSEMINKFNEINELGLPVIVEWTKESGKLTSSMLLEYKGSETDPQGLKLMYDLCIMFSSKTHSDGSTRLFTKLSPRNIKSLTFSGVKYTLKK